MLIGRDSHTELTNEDDEDDKDAKDNKEDMAARGTRFWRKQTGGAESKKRETMA